VRSDSQDPTDRPSPQDEPPQPRKPQPGQTPGGQPTPGEPSPVEPVEAKPAAAPAPSSHGTLARASRWTVGVVVLLISALLVGVAIIAVYVRDQVLDTNTYVATVAPLGANPTIQSAIANRLSTEIVTQTDIAGTANDLANRLVRQGAQERVKDLVPPLVSGITSFLDDEIKKLLATPEFEQLWNEINRSAHAGLVAVLTGTKHGAVSATSNTVTVDLGVILQRVKQRLIERGLGFAEKIPDKSIPYTVVQSNKLAKIQGLVRALNTLGTWLPWVAVAVFVGGFLITPNRRRGILTGILMVGIVDILLLALFAVLRSYYIDNLPSTVQSPQAATDIYDTVLRYLNTALQALLVAVIVILVAALYAGPSRPARWIRHQIGRGLDWAGHAIGRTSSGARAVGNAVMTIRWPLEVALAIIGVVILLVTTRPSPAAVGWLTFVLVAILVVVEILARMAGAPTPTAPADGEPIGGAPIGPRSQPTGQPA
jgi:hypothetical protein